MLQSKQKNFSRCGLISLRSFTYTDIPILQEHGYAHFSYDELKALIDTWNGKAYENSYFEMFAIDTVDETVGYASLYQRSNSIVSCGIEIYPRYQRKGYATTAYARLLDVAKELGYKIAVAQILADNIASIALNEKLGFETDHYEYINKQGNKVFCFIKPL